jgi:hypothetical protein
MADSPQWTCPTCAVMLSTPFCARCGEEPIAPRDLTMRGIGEKLIHAVTSIDARTARSAWKLLRHPGELTLAWTRGVRKPYVAPFQLFLVANVLFFALQWMTSENVFSSSLDSHLHHQDWSDLAQSQLARRLAGHANEPRAVRAGVRPRRGLQREVADPADDVAVRIAAANGLSRARRPFMVHVAFSLHLYTFLLLLFCVALLAAKLSALLGLGGLDSPMVDDVLSVANLAACALYIYLAIAPVYGAAGPLRTTKAILLAIAVAAIVIGYRFVLFFITLYAT